jgi:acyl carrier protein
LDSGVANTPAETPVEDLLTGIWKKVLDLEDIGTQENFFRVGGHSLLAAKLMNHVREAFQVDLPLSALFKNPTIAGLAGEIESSLTENNGIKPPPVRSYSRNQILPLSFSQGGNALRLYISPDNPFLNVPEMLHFKGWLNLSVLEQTLNEFIRRHEITRTTFSILDGSPVQIVHPSLELQVKEADLQHLSDEEREVEALRVATQEARIIFDLEKGPLLRALLIRMKETDNRLLITLHHQICDGYSVNHVLFPELIALYEAFLASKPSPLSEPTLQYADWVFWEREYLQDHVLAPHLAYWKQKLSDLVPLELPYDYPRPAQPTFELGRHVIPVEKLLTDRLKTLSLREGLTMFMTTMAAYQVLLFLNCRQSDIPIMTFAAGLHREEFKNLMGIFVNFLPISTKLQGGIDFRELFKRVRESTLNAYSHHELPFPKLMQEIKPKLFAGEDRAFQAVFVYYSHSPVSHPQWDISWMEVYPGTGIRDLSLEMQERPEGLAVVFQYRSELFKPETIEKLAADYVSLLETIVANPTKKLSELISSISTA